MLYLKNTLGGLSRSLTDSALHSFQGRHRWWKLALFAGLIVLPGGSLGVAILAWIEHRRGGKRGGRASEGQAADARQAADKVAAPGASVGGSSSGNAALNVAGASGACHARGDAACRAAAGKLARKNPSTDARV